MAMIVLKKGGTFFGTIRDYDWKGKFLVVELTDIVIDNEPELRIISWDNVVSVDDTGYNKEGLK